MSDEKIKLPDFLIADLYKDSLVDIETFNTTPQSAEPKLTQSPEITTIATGVKPKHLGENGKSVVIVVHEHEAGFLQENDLTFLTTVLKACQLTLADIAIVNIASQNITYDILREQFKPAQILLFDVEPSAIKLPFMIPAFQIQQFGDTTILLAPALSSFNTPTPAGKLLKTRLWTSLKQIFGLG